MAQTSAVIPKFAPAAASPVTIAAGASWANSAYSELLAATSGAAVLLGIQFSVAGAFQYEIDIAVGAAASEIPIATFRVHATTTATPRGYAPLLIPVSGIASGARISARARCSNAAASNITVKAWYAEAWDANSVGWLHLTVPSAANAIAVTPNASAWANSNYAEITSGISKRIALAALIVQPGVAVNNYELDIATGAAASETVITTVSGSIPVSGYPFIHTLPAVYELNPNNRIAVRLRKSGTDVTAWNVAMTYYERTGGGGGAGKGNSGGKKGGGGGLNILYPGGAYEFNIGNPGLDIGST